MPVLWFIQGQYLQARWSGEGEKTFAHNLVMLLGNYSDITYVHHLPSMEGAGPVRLHPSMLNFSDACSIKSHPERCTRERLAEEMLMDGCAWP